MTAEKRSSSVTSTDADDAPVLTIEFFDSADLYEGQQLKARRRPKAATTKEPVQLSLNAEVVASEVIGEALRLFEAYQSAQQSSLAALRAEINQGLADVKAGCVQKMDVAAIKAQGRALKKTS